MTIQGVLETCLYCDNLSSAEEFYSDLLGLELVSAEENRHLFYRCGDGMLLIFNPLHTSSHQTTVSDSPIPLHGTTGSGHLAFAVEEPDLPFWKQKLSAAGVQIESEVRWPNGGRSLYFRDPDGNSLELASPVIWKNRIP